MNHFLSLARVRIGRSGGSLPHLGLVVIKRCWRVSLEGQSLVKATRQRSNNYGRILHRVANLGLGLDVPHYDPQLTGVIGIEFRGSGCDNTTSFYHPRQSAIPAYNNDTQQRHTARTHRKPSHYGLCCPSSLGIWLARRPGNPLRRRAPRCNPLRQVSSYGSSSLGHRTAVKMY